ncbi:histidine phosphatase family protein [Actinophytocola gossypii]|uniref:Histidine phosphatase family protein n=1 Tax=Actinophytocola gossypii TaxID=2812003 RepID=A0ABT2J1N8_9PSEU|nr:histidine phosphatase family protein [Actinophytocola gossypii]MCT2581772.1 histidine phosphatase family protein [Actinophytocola gossypii]
MTEFVLVRHGETTWHEENRYAGRTDVSLTDRGRRQAELLGQWAAGADLTAVRTSPLGRCRDTGLLAATGTGLTPVADERLLELDFGDGEGLTAAEMTARFPDARAAFETDPVEHHLPGGEHPAHAVDRAVGCLADLAGAHPDGRVLVVGHSTLNRLLLCHLLGIPLRQYRRTFPVVRNCALTTLRWASTGTAALIELNRPVQDQPGSRTEQPRT